MMAMLKQEVTMNEQTREDRRYQNMLDTACNNAKARRNNSKVKANTNDAWRKAYSATLRVGVNPLISDISKWSGPCNMNGNKEPSWKHQPDKE